MLNIQISEESVKELQKILGSREEVKQELEKTVNNVGSFIEIMYFHLI